MVTTIGLIIVAFIVGIIDKPFLLQRPYFQFKKVVVIAALLLIAGLSVYKEWSTDQEAQATRTRESALSDRLKSLIRGERAGLRKVDSLRDIARFQNKLIDTLRVENRNIAVDYALAMQEHHISTTTILAKYGYRMDTINNEVRKINAPQEPLPTLVMYNAPELRNFASEDSLYLQLNARDADAYFEGASFVIIGMRGVEIARSKIQSIGDQGLREGEIQPSDYMSTLSLGLNATATVRHLDMTDQFILAIQIRYRSKGGISRPPLERFYTVIRKPSPGIGAVSTDNIKTLRRWLIDDGYWTRP